MVIIRNREGATGQPGCQEYLTSERWRILEALAVNTCERSCSGCTTEEGAREGVDCVGEPAGDSATGARTWPSQPAPASATAAASTAKTTAARILLMPAQPTARELASMASPAGPVMAADNRQCSLCGFVSLAESPRDLSHERRRAGAHVFDGGKVVEEPQRAGFSRLAGIQRLVKDGYGPGVA